MTHAALLAVPAAPQAAPQVSRAPASPAAPPAPATPAAEVAPGARVTVTLPGALGTRIYSAADIAALRARKDELSNLLINATRRRQELSRTLAGTSGADRAGIEQHLGVLDTRIAKLETQIDENSGQLASFDAQRTIAQMRDAPPARRNSADRGIDVGGSIAIAFVVCVLAPLSIAFSRRVWRRGGGSGPMAASPDTTHRLERIEQSIEAIAIEVERVSEGQRFVTRLMSENAGALGAGQPAMRPIPLGESVPVERR